MKTLKEKVLKLTGHPGEKTCLNTCVNYNCQYNCHNRDAHQENSF